MASLLEKGKQALGINPAGFEPSSIDHHWRMLGEAGDFAHDLKQYERAVRRWEAALTGAGGARSRGGCLRAAALLLLAAPCCC
jgi:hypothetical protein